MPNSPDEVWRYWQSEIRARDAGFVPTIDQPGKGRRDIFERDPIDGYWRIMAAMTKPDAPVVVWREDGKAEIVLQIGRRPPQTLTTDSPEWHDFVANVFPKCSAVRKAEWETALSTGFWLDKKPSRQLSAEEKVDIIPDTPAAVGGNVGDAGLSYAEQIDAKIKVLLDRAKKLGKVDTMEKGTEAATIATDLKALFDLGDRRRDEEKRPHDNAAKAVQNLWLPIITPASDMRKRLIDAIDTFKREEQHRLQREADRAAQLERERVRKETEARLLAEAEEAARQALARGETFEEPHPEEIAAQADEAAAEVLVEQVEAPRVAPAFGRGISKAKKKVGVITDRAKFVAALDEQQDFLNWLQDKADRLARAGVALAGMKIEEE